MLVLLSACSGKHVHGSGPRSTSPCNRASELEGLASYYAEPHHGRPTANGEVFDTGIFAYPPDKVYFSDYMIVAPAVRGILR
jgi:hypothetical protein